MTVTYKPFESQAGFKSPGFTVDPLGALVSDSIDTALLKLSGVSVLDTTTLGSTVVNSSLTNLGTLTGLTVNGTSAISITTTGTITIVPTVVGNINNMNIGNITPGTGSFTAVSGDTIIANTITAGTNLYIGNLNVKSYAAALAVALS